MDGSIMSSVADGRHPGVSAGETFTRACSAELTYTARRRLTRFRMSASAPRDSVIAVVGDGFGSLIVHSTARYLGFENDQITIF